MTWWRSFVTHAPEPQEVVLVISEGWEHPKVLRYVQRPIGYIHAHRLYEMDESRFYYYPERMRWMPIPPHDSRKNPAEPT